MPDATDTEVLDIVDGEMRWDKPVDGTTSVSKDDELADFSSFKVPNKILKKIGELARRGSALTDADDLEDLTRDDWKLLEEVITGFENR